MGVCHVRCCILNLMHAQWTVRTAEVAWPLTSLTPKISALGKLVEIWTLKGGLDDFASGSSSSISSIDCSLSVSHRKLHIATLDS